jgi:hypothetical protein
MPVASRKIFLFRLTRAEVEALNRSHFATGSQKHRDPRFPPYAFTEHGAMMAAMVLNSPRAVQMSVYVVRAFVKLRELLASNRELARRFEQLEARVEKLVAHDQALGVILSAIRKLMRPPPEASPRTGRSDSPPISARRHELSNKELARRFDQLEARLDKKLTEHDEAIAAILSAIRQLMNPPTPRRGIGFTADLDNLDKK